MIAAPSASDRLVDHAAAEVGASAWSGCERGTRCGHPVHEKWDQDLERHVARLLRAQSESDHKAEIVYRCLRETRGPTFAQEALQTAFERAGTQPAGQAASDAPADPGKQPLTTADPADEHSADRMACSALDFTDHAPEHPGDLAAAFASAPVL